MPLPDRRKHPRVASSVQCAIGLASGWVQTRTLNLSCGGALCSLSESIPPMTKLEIRLEIPGDPSNGAPTVQRIHCIGVVVRQERSVAPDDPAPFRTAITFSDLKSEDRRRLGEFILRSMVSHGHRGS